MKCCFWVLGCLLDRKAQSPVRLSGVAGSQGGPDAGGPGLGSGPRPPVEVALAAPRALQGPLLQQLFCAGVYTPSVTAAFRALRSPPCSAGSSPRSASGRDPLVRLPSAVVCPPRVFPVNSVDQCVIFHSWFLSWAQPDFLFFFFPQVPWSLRTCPPSCRG